jgi:hypothetical protein
MLVSRADLLSRLVFWQLRWIHLRPKLMHQCGQKQGENACNNVDDWT